MSIFPSLLKSATAIIFPLSYQVPFPETVLTLTGLANDLPVISFDEITLFVGLKCSALVAINFVVVFATLIKPTPALLGTVIVKLVAVEVLTLALKAPM